MRLLLVKMAQANLIVLGSVTSSGLLCETAEEWLVGEKNLNGSF